MNFSFAEALQKNRLRYNPERPYSILEHGLSDDSMMRLYRQDDWQGLTACDADWIETGSHRMPYVVFDSEDDATTGKPRQLTERLQKTLDRLGVLIITG